jgi:ribulose-phosphate 3-epimerase
VAFADAQRKARLGAALFNADHGRLAEEISRLVEAGLDFVHLDVFDGRLVPDLGFPPRTIAVLRPLTHLPFEVHLAAVDPLRFVPALVDAGVELILFHPEGTSLLYETVFAIREHGVRVGLALSLGTPLSILEPVISSIDAILLLSRVTGESAHGATFNPLVYPRLCAARQLVQSSGAHVEIQVAGGVNKSHVRELLDTGADALALGSGIYRTPDMATEIAHVRALGQQP